MQFFLAFRLSTREGGRRLVKNLKEIRSNYLSGWFAIDLISVLPFDLFALGGGGPEFLTRLKLLRVIRLLRLLKLARVLKASRMLARYETVIDITYAQRDMVKFSIMIIVMAHWLACLWGLIDTMARDAICSHDGSSAALLWAEASASAVDARSLRTCTFPQ